MFWFETTYLRMATAAVLVAILAACGGGGGGGPSDAGTDGGSPDTGTATVEVVEEFGPNPGALSMYAYVPDNLPAGSPLVVAMHGCGQAASDYDSESGWTRYADRDAFALIFPETGPGNNPNRCFNWFQSDHNRRESGEARSIKSMVDHLLDARDLDPERVYATGLSAGGYMTSVLLATYPDVFAGGAVLAGGPYRCADGFAEAVNCMNPGIERGPKAWGDRVRNASDHEGPWPVVSIWHGEDDSTVDERNRRENVKQWTDVHGIDQTADVSETVGGYPREVHERDGEPVVESYTITDLGHGIPIDPGAAEDQCGKTGPYMLEADICSTFHIGRFWGIVEP